MNKIIKLIWLLSVVGIFASPAQARDSAYQIIQPRSSDAVGCWINDYKKYQHIVGYSSLGHVFLYSPKDSDYAIFYPFKAAAKSYGKFESVSAFEKIILQEAGFNEVVLKPAHVKNIETKLGKLSKEQVYIPSPYPFLGGGESADSYKKGDIWIMLDIVSQMKGDC
ncbi:MAG: T6SS immunity protein Tdi1 domain-containing protein [Cocleimonas sp.]